MSAKASTRLETDRYGALLTQALMPICVTRGPDHRVEVMNPAFQALCGVDIPRGDPLREASPGLDPRPGLPIFDLLDRAFHGGERLVATEVVAASTDRDAARLPSAAQFFNVICDPLRDRAGAVEGLMISAVDVTAHVQGRRVLEEAEHHLKFLVDAGAALSESLDYRRTLRRVAELSVPRIADWCTVTAVDARGALQRLAVVHRDASKRSLVEEYEERFPPDGHRAGELAGTLKQDRAILRAVVTDAELVLAAQGPEHLRIMRGLGCASCIMVPMVVRGEAVGVISLIRSEPGRPYAKGDLVIAEELAHRAALAIDNAQLYQAARRREETMRFFATASAQLNSSLDYDLAFDKLARLVVPSFADWCAVDVKEEEKIRQVAVAHVNPAKVKFAHEMRRRYPPDLQAPTGVANVMRTGRSELYEDIPDALLVKGTRDAEHLRIARELGLRSLMMVPLVGRGQPIGVLTLVWAESGHQYGPADLAVMEELGRRAGFALENARLYQQTQGSVRLRDEFISIASHELKTPLTSMQLQISGIRRAAENPAQLDPAKLARRVDVIDRQVERLVELVDGLLDVSRASAGQLRLNLEQVDLAHVIAEVVERFSDQLITAGCKLTVNVEGPIIGRWDRLRLDDVVTNLLGNAMKYGAGMPIELSAAVAAGTATIRVQDFGIGIPPVDQERIFQQFARAVSHDHYGGFGLGLWIVQVLVQAMGGSIGVESAVGKGSIFTAKLPLKREHGEPTSV
jgi:signal transduction histidine kinase/PAS domain-containing protein